MARLKRATTGLPVVRMDHIGSTAVPGIKAKNLIDIQIMVPAIGDAEVVAEAATTAGFVSIDGELFGKDRRGGTPSREGVCRRRSEASSEHQHPSD